MTADTYDSEIIQYAIVKSDQYVAHRQSTIVDNLRAGLVVGVYRHGSGKRGSRNRDDVGPANYILVRRMDDGSRTPLALGQTKDDAISLNLAHLRHQGARLGANEVHIHLLAETTEERANVEGDLNKAHFPSIAANAA